MRFSVRRRLRAHPPEWAAYSRRLQEARERGLSLRRARRSARPRPEPPPETVCPSCEGKGMVLSPFGREVLSVVRRYLLEAEGGR